MLSAHPLLSPGSTFSTAESWREGWASWSGRSQHTAHQLEAAGRAQERVELMAYGCTRVAAARLLSKTRNPKPCGAECSKWPP